MILSVQNSGFLRKEYTMIYSIYRRICAKILRLYYLSEIKNAEKYANCKIRFVPQGEGGVFIAHPENFKIAPTSHLKSNTYIECSGGVSIGEYFHTGRGLTIFSSNHVYNNDNSIPYDKVSQNKSVQIKDFVWLGANVTIVPGITIGEGVVAGAGSVITKDIPDYAVIGGNPATIIKYRDITQFQKLKAQGRFY